MPERKKKTSIGKRCCSKTSIRRLVRILYLLAIILVATLGVYLIISNMYTSKTETLSASSPIKIVSRNCKLYIEEDENVGAGSIEMKAEVPGNKIVCFLLIYLGGDLTIDVTSSPQTITMINTDDFIDACWLRLEMREGTVMSDFTYECEGECLIIHESPEELTMGSLKVSGAYVAMNLQSVAPSNVDIDIEQGTVYIHNLITTSMTDTVGTIITGGGDIVVQSTTALGVQWTLDSNHICLGAITQTAITEPAGCYLYLGDDLEGEAENAETTSCTGAYNLCPESGCSDPVPLLTAQVTDGNIYANIIEKANQPLATTGTILVKGYDYGTIGFSNLLETDIDRQFAYFNNTEKADSLLIFNLGGVHISESSSLRFIAATNPAYIDGQPWYKLNQIKQNNTFIFYSHIPSLINLYLNLNIKHPFN
jgi:hypothetical protein